LQQDNDPKHTVTDQKINVMPWPAQSPDLNPIETLWNDVEKAINRAKPSSIPKLEQLIYQAWAAIPVDRCQRLIDSMPHRCAAVIRNKGYPTKY
jgi:hypothetical protein